MRSTLEQDQEAMRKRWADPDYRKKYGKSLSPEGVENWNKKFPTSTFLLSMENDKD